MHTIEIRIGEFCTIIQQGDEDVITHEFKIRDGQVCQHVVYQQSPAAFDVTEPYTPRQPGSPLVYAPVAGYYRLVNGSLVRL